MGEGPGRAKRSAQAGRADLMRTASTSGKCGPRGQVRQLGHV